MASQADVIATHKLETVAMMMRATILDHIVVTGNQYFSMRQNHLLLSENQSAMVEEYSELLRKMREGEELDWKYSDFDYQEIPDEVKEAMPGVQKIEDE